MPTTAPTYEYIASDFSHLGETLRDYRVRTQPQAGPSVARRVYRLVTRAR
jgi:hypothetical protein